MPLILGAGEAAGVMFSPWHPAAIPKDESALRFHAVLDPIAQNHNVTVQQIALAWQLHRSPIMLPIPGTTSIAHMKENWAATNIGLTIDEVTAITALVPEETCS